MMPGALAAMAAVLLSGRTDWYGRTPYFAMFGALGWSFGGSISYMQVIAYTHSGHSESVLYGFACLFVIGFLWAAPGGVGTALPAVASRDRLTELLGPVSAVLAAWQVEGWLVEPWLHRVGYSLNWFDTDWLGALVALGVGLVLAMARGRVDRATSLILYMAGGWWVGFVILVLVLGLRMTPPRGDNWAGCLGMTVGLFVYCLRTGLPEVARAGVVTGVVGGISFAGASMIKLVAVTSGFVTNWHSVLEQTTGFINGLGVALAMWHLARWSAPVDDRVTSSDARPWAKPLAVAFTLLAIPMVNLKKNAGDWVSAKAVPAEMYGFSAEAWLGLAFAIVAVGLFAVLYRHARRPIAVVPESRLGQGQGLYLLLLAIVVIGNFERILVRFADQRLITEGVIHVNAVICAVLLLLASPSRDQEAASPSPRLEARERPIRWGRLVAVCVAASLLAIFADWAIVRGIYGDRFAGHASLHIRFGPRATVNSPTSPR
ncbi:hypothetical protein [Paludisphaera borealis]|nr:hypothetical protein [Paludisphaera borealis]